MFNGLDFFKISQSCILNNGWTRDFVSVQSGVRQGCPLSPNLFILSAEILAKVITLPYYPPLVQAPDNLPEQMQ